MTREQSKEWLDWWERNVDKVRAHVNGDMWRIDLFARSSRYTDFAKIVKKNG